MHRLRRPSPALAVSIVALVVALGGTAYAAFKLPAASVGSKQLRNGAVTPAKVSRAAVKRFRGQTGPTGPRGADGAAGQPGSDGAPGQPGADAASAFTGVVEETPNGPSVVYCPPQGQVSDGSAVLCSAGDQLFSQGSPNASMTGRDLFVRQDTAPGVGAGRTYTLRVNGLDTAVSCTIAGTATTCTSGGARTAIPPGSRLVLKVDGGSAASASAGRTTFGWRATTP